MPISPVRKRRATPPRGQGRPARRQPLDRPRIAAAALALIDAEGLAGFSTRRLGEVLGVEAMSLYHHYSSKDAILDAVMELLVAEIEVPPAGTWIERLRRAGYSYREVALRHPKAFVLLVTRPYMTDRLLQFCDDALGAVRGSGCDELTMARAFRLFGHFLDGACLYVAEGPARRQGEPVPPPAPVDAGRFPHLAAARPHLARAQADAMFEFGLEQMLTSLQVLVTESGAAGTATS